MVLKKGDFFIILVLLLAVLGWFLQSYVQEDSGNLSAVIELDGKHYQTLSLNENARFKIDFPDQEYMELTIENKEIWISEKTVYCPHNVCVKTGKISKPGESIVCLPNKTVIFIEGDSASSPENRDDTTYVDDTSY